MKTKMLAIWSAGLVLLGAMALTSDANAQAWSEANTPGFFGGYGHFGGYYDTFGIYGGVSTYAGYRRAEAPMNTQTTTLLTVPLQKRSQTKRSAKVKIVHVQDECGWIKRRAHDTGSRKWKHRYDVCRGAV